VPSGFVEELAGELSHSCVRDGPREETVPHHPRDVEVLDHEDLRSVHQGLGCLVDQVSSGVGDLAMGLRETSPPSLATFGPRCGSGQGLIGRLERRVRLLQCFHPLEALEGNTVRVRGDAEGDDPSVDPDGDGVLIGAAALGLVELRRHTSQRHRPTSCALGQRRRVDVESTHVNHPADLASGAEELHRSEPR